MRIKIYSTFSEPILIEVNLPKPDFLFANLSPVEKVKLVDGEGHLIVVRIVLKKFIQIRFRYRGLTASEG